MKNNTKPKSLLINLLDLFSNNPDRNLDLDIQKQIKELSLEKNKNFAVVRDDNKIIIQFYHQYEARSFAEKLNYSYKRNGLNTNSRVINLKEYLV